jgi:DNA-binding transcriptional regulator WhiA
LEVGEVCRELLIDWREHLMDEIGHIDILHQNNVGRGLVFGQFQELRLQSPVASIRKIRELGDTDTSVEKGAVSKSGINEAVRLNNH